MTTLQAPATVRAIVQHRYGGPDTWAPGTVARPAIGPGEVLVQMRAAAIDRGTWHLMAGTPYIARPAFGLRRPRRPVPGLDVAGVVVDVGDGVTRFRIGDDVFGIGRGSLATVCAAREDKLVRKPSALTFGEAAAMSVSGLTALQAVCDVGRLKPGQRVLVTGASGGVGSFAVQIAASHGAVVTGVCSAAKVGFVANLGAQHVIDHKSTDLASIDERFDLVIDTVGDLPLRRIRRLLTPRGTLVIVGNASGGRWFAGLDRQLRGMLWSPLLRQRITAFVSREHHRDLQRLADLAADGRLVPRVDRTYHLDDAADAMRRLDAGLARGKIVVTTDPAATGPVLDSTTGTTGTNDAAAS